jgi:hypothetical protein
MASGYDYILIYKPASADELIRAIDVAKSLQMAFVRKWRDQSGRHWQLIFVVARRVELSQ